MSKTGSGTGVGTRTGAGVDRDTTCAAKGTGSGFSKNGIATPSWIKNVQATKMITGATKATIDSNSASDARRPATRRISRAVALSRSEINSIQARRCSDRSGKVGANAFSRSNECLASSLFLLSTISNSGSSMDHECPAPVRPASANNSLL